MPEGYYRQGKPKKPKPTPKPKVTKPKPTVSRPRHVYTPAPSPEPRVPSSQPISEHAMVSKARTAQRTTSRARVNRNKRDALIWSSEHSIYVPAGLHTKIKNKQPLTEGEAFAAVMRGPLTTKEGQRRQATRGQRAQLASAQSAKRQVREIMAGYRPLGVEKAIIDLPYHRGVHYQPETRTDAVAKTHKRYQYTPGQAATTRKAEIAKVKNLKLAQDGKISQATLDQRNRKIDRTEHERFKRLQQAGLVAPFNEGGMLGRSITDLVSIAAHTPGGLVRMFSQNPVKTAQELGLGIYEDLRHPLRYPDRTLLDIFGIASGGAAALGRGGAALGTLGRVGEVGLPRTAAQLAKDIAFSPLPRDRFLRNPHAPREVPLTPRERKVQALADQSPFTGEREVAAHMLRDKQGAAEAQGIHIQGSRNPLLNRVIHPMYDYALPRAGPIGRRAAERKYAIHKGRGRAVEQAVNESHANAVTRAGIGKWLGKHRLDTGEEFALRAVIEGVHPEDWARLHAQLKRESPEFAKGHERMRKNYTEAVKHVHVEGRHLVMNDPKMQGLAEEMLRTQKSGEDLAVSYGLLDPAVAENRIRGPRDIVGGVLGHHTLHDLEPQGYVSYAERPSRSGMTRSRGGTVSSRMQKDPELTKVFTGESILRGNLPPLTTASIGRVALGRARVAHFFDSLEDMRAHGLRPDDPQIMGLTTKELDSRYVALNPGKPANEWRRELDRRLGKTNMAHDAEEVMGLLYDDLVLEHPSQHLAKKGILFVPKRLVKELRPEASHGKLTAGLRFYDEVNRTHITAMLYLNGLKYVAVNAPGQVFLMLTDQGFMAPINIKRAVNMWHDIPEQTRTAALGSVGGRFERGALGGQPTDPYSWNVVVRGGQKYAHVAGKILDDAPKVTALVKEARKRGYDTPEKFEQLWSQDAPAQMKTDRQIIARKVLDDYLDYSAMSHTERQWMTRLIRFYPWLKASTRYVGRYATEHPVQAAIVTQEGARAQEHQQNILGDLPWYRHGLVPIGSSGTVIDPTSAGIVSQTPELAHDLIGLLGSQPQEAMGYFTPPITDIAGMGGVQLGRDYPIKGKTVFERLGVTAAQQMPLGSLLMRPHGTSTMPRTLGQSLARTFGAGGFIPDRPVLSKLHTQAREERVGAMEPKQRLDYYTAEALQEFETKSRNPKFQVTDYQRKKFNEGIRLQRQQQLGRIDAGLNSKSDIRDKLNADVDTALRLKLMHPEEARVWREQIKKTPKDRVSSYLSPALKRRYFGSYAVSYLKSRLGLQHVQRVN